MKEYRAIISWKTAQNGGRKTLPTGSKYAPIIKVEQEQCNDDSEWSILVTIRSILSKQQTIACMRYLSTSAPDKLKIGDKFSLLEGNRVIATGMIYELQEK